MVCHYPLDFNHLRVIQSNYLGLWNPAAKRQKSDPSPEGPQSLECHTCNYVGVGLLPSVSHLGL